MTPPRITPLFAALAVLLGAVSTPAAIIVDGVNQGGNFTLTTNASSIFLTAATDVLRINANINNGLTLTAVADSQVSFAQGNISGGLDFTGGDIQIARNANINGGLTVRDGNAELRGGNISGGLDLFAGTVTLDARPNLNLNGDINAFGGGLFAERTSNLNGNITFSGDAVGFFGENARNINGRLFVEDDAAVFLSDPRTASAPGTDADGRVLSQTGQITGLGNNLSFSTTPERNLFLGADRSDAEEAIAAIIPAAVPEPTRALIALLGFAIALLQRRR